MYKSFIIIINNNVYCLLNASKRASKSASSPPVAPAVAAAACLVLALPAATESFSGFNSEVK